MVISMRSTKVKQFLLKIVKFVFCHSKNTTKLYMSGSHNSKITRHKIICVDKWYRNFNNWALADTISWYGTVFGGIRFGNYELMPKEDKFSRPLHVENRAFHCTDSFSMVHWIFQTFFLLKIV